MRNKFFLILGWILIGLGLLQAVSVFNYVNVLRVSGEFQSWPLVNHLLQFLLGLLLILIGYIIRRRLTDHFAIAGWGAGLYYALFVLLLNLSRYHYLPPYGIEQYFIPFSYLLSLSVFVVLSQILLLVILIVLYTKLIPSEAEFVKTCSPWRFLGMFLALGLVTLAAYIASGGRLQMFIDPASLFIVVLPLPVLLALSGLHPANLIEFIAGIVFLGFVRKEKLQAYLRYAKRAGTFVLLMGGVGLFIGGITILANLDEPSTLGPAIAVCLISLFYGLLLKTVVFAPYAAALKRTLENSASE